MPYFNSSMFNVADDLLKRCGWFANHALPCADKSWQGHPTKSSLKGILSLGSKVDSRARPFGGTLEEILRTSSISGRKAPGIWGQSMSAGDCFAQWLMASLKCLASVGWAGGHSFLSLQG